jgi:hypothetical protein
MLKCASKFPGPYGGLKSTCGTPKESTAFERCPYEERRKEF